MSRVLVIGSTAESLVNFRGALLRALVAAGHQVLACSPPTAVEDIPSRLKAWGVDWCAAPFQRTGMNPVSDLRTVWSLWRRMRQYRPDVVLAYTIKPVVWGMVAAWLAGVPRRVSLITGLGFAFTSGPTDSLKRRGLAALARLLYRVAMQLSHRVIFQNSDDKAYFIQQDLLRDPSRALVVAGSGVDLADFAHSPDLPQQPKFLMIARLLADKGLREYAQAAALLRSSHPKAQVHLVGPPDTNPSAVPLVEVQRWHDEGSLTYWGQLDDVRPALRSCSVFVLPSYREGVPRTGLEALATGRAVITTDAPGCREVVEHGVNGLLVPVGDAASLHAAMAQLVDDPALCARMGAASRQRAQRLFDVHAVNRDMLCWMGLSDHATTRSVD